MPNRIIRDAILTSEAVCSLGWADEVFYRRLMSIVDDYGRHEASAQLLRSRCYPLQTDAVRVADISRSMAACQSAGLIALYESNGKQYLELQKFGQQTRSPSKHPPPPDGLCKPLLAIDSKCLRPIANAHLVGDVVGVDKEPTVLVDAEPSTRPEPPENSVIELSTRGERLACPLELLAKTWNEIAISLPAVKPAAEWHHSRRTAMQARWRERWVLKKYANEADGLAYWRALFAAVEASDFLSGRGESGWGNCSFDWVLQPKNFTKLAEGNYVNVVGKFKGGR